MRVIALVCTLAAAGALLLGGCSTAPKTAQETETLDTAVQNTIRMARTTDPGLQSFFDKSAGYAVFPRIGSGAAIVGAAFGRGEVFEKGQLVGYATLNQASVGLSLGGQEYSEIIFFETPEALNNFKSGNYALAAETTAVALTTGAAAKASFSNGVAVFTMRPTGLMFSAAVAGQKFNFQPAGTTTTAATTTSTTPATQPAGARR